MVSVNKPPVIGAIRTLADVKNALENIRVYFSQTISPILFNVIPGGNANLRMKNNKTLQVDESWTLGRVLSQGGSILSTKQCLNANIGGRDVNIALLEAGTIGQPVPPGESPWGGTVPSGGTTDQVLSKKSDADYDTQWATITPPIACSKSEVFTGSGTFTVPTGVTLVQVTLVGGGGGGGGGYGATYGGGGGGGGELRYRIPVNLTGISSVAVTIPAAAGGGAVNNDGSDGGDVTFGTYVTAKGGHKGNKGLVGADGAGGNGGGLTGGAGGITAVPIPSQGTFGPMSLGGSGGGYGAYAGAVNSGIAIAYSGGSGAGHGGGGGAGPNGAGGNGAGGAAGANSGAGGGGGTFNQAGGAGGTGWALVEWIE